MSSTQPPKVATWFLKYFGCSANNEAVIGDLAEQYRQGRSRPWYWYQVLTACVIGTYHDIRSHILLSLRALMVGWFALYSLFSFLLTNMFLRFAERLFPRLTPGASMVTWWLPQDWWNQSATGPLYWDSVTAVFTLLVCVVGLTCGCLVARLNGGRQSMVLLYTASVLFFVFSQAIAGGPQNLGYPAGYFWIHSILLVSGILFGGLSRTGDKTFGLAL